MQQLPLVLAYSLSYTGSFLAAGLGVAAALASIEPMPGGFGPPGREGSLPMAHKARRIARVH
jgi:hypothetical protein